MSAWSLTQKQPTAYLKRGVAFAIAFVMALAMMMVATPKASAESAELTAQGVTVGVTLNGEKYKGTDVIRYGDTLKMVVQYGQDTVPGSDVKIKLSANAVFTTTEIHNEAVESITVDGGELTVKFKDDFGDINQGIFELEFKILEGSEAGSTKVSWSIGDEETSLNIIVVDKNHKFGPVQDAIAKSLNTEDLQSPVYLDEDGEIQIGSELAKQAIPYTISAATNGGSIEITDVLPEGLIYVPGSFKAYVTEWDAEGVNSDSRTEDPVSALSFDNNSFTATFTNSKSGGAPMEVALTYEAKLDPAKLNDIKDALQAKYDEAGLSKQYISSSFKNTVTLNGDKTSSATLTIGYDKDGVEIGKAFAKSFTPNQTVLGDDSGKNINPVPVTVKLTANLTNLFNSATDTSVIGHNVIIQDTLPAGVSWTTEAEPFITTTSDLTLEAADVATCDVETMKDTQPGEWCVDGQALLVNVGKDTSKNYAITAKAQVDSVLATEGTNISVPEGTKLYKIKNTASFHYAEDSKEDKNGTVEITVLPPRGDGGFQDDSRFNKSDNAPTKVNINETAKISYDFYLAAGVPDVDVTKSAIVDKIDTDVFNLEEGIEVFGNYGGKNLEEEDFTIAVSEDGELNIQLSATGKAKAEEEGQGKQWFVKITLTTHKFDGKETKTITNKATLVGEKSEPLFWSTTEAESTSYGDEAEVRKRIYNVNTEEGLNPWVSELDALTSEEDFHANPFIYRVEFIPHGSYNNVTITDVVDELPSNLEFLGFIDQDDLNADDLESVLSEETTLDIGANLEATYAEGADGEASTVVIRQKEGTKLNKSDNPRPTVYFVAKATDNSEEITNAIGETFAKIKPLTAEVSWQKTDNLETLLGGSTWLLAGPAGYVEEITDNGALDSDERDGFFSVKHLNYGDYTLTEIEAPEGHILGDVTIDFTIDTEEYVIDLGDIENQPKSYAIGDYVWIDTNKDGLQGEDEKPLDGVMVEIIDENGDSVVDVNGETVAPTFTDRNGWYMFDNLKAGKYRVKFTLTEEQSKIYVFTEDLVGDDQAVDSDADRSTGLSGLIVLDDSNAFLTLEYSHEFEASEGIDPTWDAGVILADIDESGNNEGNDNETPAEQPKDDEKAGLSDTGGALPWIGLTTAMLMLAAGAVMLARRKSKATVL